MINKKCIFIVSITLSLLHLSEAILCGKLAEDNQFKYTVAITWLTMPLCSGSIIDEYHILTAAHCFIDLKLEELFVVAGLKNVEWMFAFGQTRAIKRIHQHPDFYPGIENPSTFMIFFTWTTRWAIGDWVNPKSDIAVLTLHVPLLIGESVEIINMINSPGLPYDVPCEYPGFGLIDQDTNTRLHWTTMFIMKCDIQKDVCDHARKDEFCAYDEERKSCGLTGDSGSPLVCNNVIVGITANGKTSPKYPTVFTSVYAHREFIKKVLDEDKALMDSNKSQ